MMRLAHALRFFWLSLVLLGSVGCAQSEDAKPQAVALPKPPTTIQFRYLVYATQPPATDLLDRLGGHAMLASGALRRVDATPALATEAVVSAQWLDDVAAYPPPDRDALRYLGRGLEIAQIDALQRASGVLVLDFAHPRSMAVQALRQADALVADLLAVPGTLPFDIEFRRVVDPAIWRRERVDDVSSPYPSILRHVAIHAYRDGEWIRAVSVGMGKFGLPDLSVDRLASSAITNTVWMINGIGQRMIEGQNADQEGVFALDMAQIARDDVREAIDSALLSNATGKGRFQLAASALHEGDNDNTLLSISFPDYQGVDEFARHQSALREVFGWRGEIRSVAHDQALEEASLRARERLPELRAVIQRGLAPNEAIQVKLPFDTASGGAEWMWVEVSRWEKGKITGLLQSEPFGIPDLHAGQRVSGDDDDVFDYLYQRADGTIEGNETTAIIEKMRGTSERAGAD